MEQELSILILEDDPRDTELILRELREGGVPCVPKCVAEEEEFVAALGESRPDLILSDYKLPGLTGVDAMVLARQQHPEVPFILVTGVLGEEMAVGMIKGGATDFVLKHQLFQLVPAILRSLREAEQLTQLRESETKYRSIFENASEGIFQTTPEGHFLSANPALARMSGYDSPDELMAHCPDIGQQLCVDPESRLVLKRRLEAEGYVQDFENRIYCKDGSIKWVRINAHVVRDAAGKVLYYEGTSQDITEQKRAAVQLATLAHAVETTSEAICITDLHDRFTFVNRAFQKIYGYTEAEILGKTPTILFAPSNPPSLLAEILEQSRLGRWRGEVLDLRKDGSELPIHLSTSQIKDHSGQVIGLMGVAQDITERKRAEAILRESEEKFRTLFESAPIGIALHDSLGHYVHTNHAYERMVGYSGQELRRVGVKAVTHPDDIEEGRQLFRELREGKRECYQREKRYLRKDGRVVWGQSSASAVRGANGQLSFVISMVEDITERKQLENELLEISASERRHIGHELHDGLGQYLAGIAFRAKALQQALAAEGLGHAAEAQELATLVSNAISQTRNLARGLDPIEVETIGLLAALQNLAAEVEKFFSVVCSFRCKEANLPLDARRSLVLYRIAQEAVHNALSHGEAGQIVIELAMRADRLCLAIHDNGTGFEVESRRQAGMGMRVMEYRARSIGAKLEVISQPNQGTEVRCLVQCTASNGANQADRR